MFEKYIIHFNVLIFCELKYVITVSNSNLQDVHVNFIVDLRILFPFHVYSFKRSVNATDIPLGRGK